MELEMPKAAGADMKTVTLAARAQPKARQIMRFAAPAGANLPARSPAAAKQADQLKSSENGNTGSIDPRQMRY
jgi:hypothetical protein